MSSLRRFSYVAFGVACAHLIFGAIVRISGSGMGCGDHWPKCYGSWFPPFSRPDLVIEVSHRYLASILLVSLIALLVAAWRRRTEPGVAGPGGVLRSASLAVALGVAAALLGAITVKLGNVPFATLAHWTVAMSLIATVVATVIRAGGLGGASALAGEASAKTRRAAFAGAAMALVAVVMGGLTAKYPGAAVACPSFPLCGTNPDVQGAAVHVQLTHRVVAVLLVLHLFGLVMALRKRQEAPVIRRAATIAFSLGVLQILVAGAMIGMHLPPVLRSVHEAIGVSIWISTFALAYLARIASGGATVPRAATYPNMPAVDSDELSDAGVIRASSSALRQALSSAVSEPIALGAVAEAEPWQAAVEPAPFAAADDVSWNDGDVLDEVAVAAMPADVADVLAEPVATPDVVVAVESPAVELAVELPAAELTVEVPTAELAVEVPAVEPSVELETVQPATPKPAAVELAAVELETTEPAPPDPAPVEVVASAATADELAVAQAALPVATHPQDAGLAITPAQRSTMMHTVAVIVARGADL